ncbi:MAG TPA: ABC transporter ATP-binding protein [Anaerolineae bacterium]|nr:ABC transporter ATP-binding protein [Anaerolineae bacterium]HMR66483.1 ABC transporter ATP-binding protein [Anaerolineae bacterium]
MAPFLEMRAITKQFPGVLANDRIDLTVEAGEIHALLGENGAGKSTLMNILYGLIQRDAGEIRVEGQPVELRSPSDAISRGIGMIHQDFMLIPRFTVIENVVLGLDEDSSGPLLNLAAAARRLTDLSRQHGLDVNPAARVEHLSVGVEQRVEILKLLYRRARLLILDEPTAVLTPQEAEGLFKVLRSLAAQGHAVVFITHKLHEVMAVADRVTVLRDGRVIATVETAATNPRELARMMVGREVEFRLDKPARPAGKRILRIEDLHAADDSGHHKLRGIDLEVHGGEIVGLAGVDGNGQSELAEALMNLRTIQRGRIWVDSVEVTHGSPATHRAAGMAYIPADRRKVGSVGALSIAYNAILGNLRPYTRAGRLLLHERWINGHAQALVERFDVRTPDVAFEAGKLSGGNLQKVVLGREVMRRPRLLIVEQPTRGLDVGATEYVRQQLLAERARGVAILLISAELEEIMTLSDRIAVIYQGQIMGILPAAAAEAETLGLMMAGSRAENLAQDKDHG